MKKPKVEERPTPIEDAAVRQVEKATERALKAARCATSDDNQWSSGFLTTKVRGFAFCELIIATRELGIAEQALANVRRIKRIAREA